MVSATLQLLACAALATVASAGNLRSMPGVSAQVIEDHLLSAITNTADTTEASHRVLRLEKQLRPIYDALPKIEKGGMSHASVRYVLHRFFMQRYTWFVRGLEPGDKAAAALQTNFTLGSAPVWPSFLQGELEKSLHNGLTLRDVASLAAALEELEEYDVRNRLTMAYDGIKLSTDSKLSSSSTLDVLKEYMLLYTSGWNMTEMSTEQLQYEERKHFHSNRWVNMFTPWLEKLQTTVAEEKGLDLEDKSFENVAGIADEVGRRFYELNNLDCSSLKNTLMEIEDRKPGRVRLSDFYNKSRFSKFAFTEKIDYLRTLGALDESNASNPLVITTNYVTAMPQCLKASSLYTVCCPNECETLMGSIENAIAAPDAAPDRIARLVADLSTDTVQAPRELPQGLLQRLDEIATHHGGKVPVHGRLFAQWLHHAFPRECPYPHEVSTTNPLTPDEWMEKSGQESEQASDEEMNQHIREDDMCPAEGCGEQHSELPWNSIEELFHARDIAAKIVDNEMSTLDGAESEVKMLLEEVDESVAPASGGGFGTACTVVAGVSALGVAAAVRSQFFSAITADKPKSKDSAQEVMWHGSCV